MESPDYNAWQFWGWAGSWLFNGLVALYLWFARRHQATIRLVETTKQELGGRMDMAERNIVQVQADLRHMPTQAQIRDLNFNMGTLAATLEGVKGRLEGINRVADLMNEHLINQQEGR